MGPNIWYVPWNKDVKTALTELLSYFIHVNYLIKISNNRLEHKPKISQITGGPLTSIRSTIKLTKSVLIHVGVGLLCAKGQDLIIDGLRASTPFLIHSSEKKEVSPTAQKYHLNT